MNMKTMALLGCLSAAERLNGEVLEIFDKAGVAVVLCDYDIVPAPRRSKYDLVGINNVEAGADGVSVFNLFTYDHMPGYSVAPWKFVTEVGLDPETVRRHPRSIPEKFFYERKGAVPPK